MTKCHQNIIIRPIITEKSTSLTKQNKYSFCVAKNSTKLGIKSAFQEIFPGSKITSVQTLKIRGHKKRTKSGFKSPRDWKKAVITATGAKIEYFPELN